MSEILTYQSTTQNPSPLSFKDEKILYLMTIASDEDKKQLEHVLGSKRTPLLLKKNLLKRFIQKYNISCGAPHEKQKPKRKRRSGLEYDCQKRAQLLNTVYHLNGAPVSEIALEASYNPSRCNSALLKLIELGFVSREKNARSYLYSITEKGRKYLISFRCAYWQWEIKGSIYTHCQNAQRNAESSFFEASRMVTKTLLKWGWYHRWVKKCLKEYSLPRILKEIKKIQSREDIKNKGAYLFCILKMNKKMQLQHESKEFFCKRIFSASKKILGNFSLDVQKKFIDESMNLDVKTAIHLANAVRKKGEKMMKKFESTLKIYDVEVTLNHIRKKQGGAYAL